MSGYGSSDNRGKFIWGKEAVMALIDSYQNQPILYNLQHPDYKNKIKRDAALNSITDELLKLPICLNQCLQTEDVKNKIHTMRSQFNKEWKKRESSLRSGAGSAEVFVPTLWFFQYLLFLKDVDDTSASKCNLGDLAIVGEDPTSEIDDEVVFDGTVEALNEGDIIMTPSRSSSSRSNTRQKTPSIQKEVARLIEDATSALRESKQPRFDEDITTFSRCIEAEMRKIKSEVRLRRLKRLVMDLIFSGQEEEEAVLS